MVVERWAEVVLSGQPGACITSSRRVCDCSLMAIGTVSVASTVFDDTPPQTRSSSSFTTPSAKAVFAATTFFARCPAATSSRDALSLSLRKASKNAGFVTFCEALMISKPDQQPTEAPEMEG